MTVETIPIPTEKAKRKEPIRLETTELDAWPGHRFEIRFDWNGQLDRWVLRLTHVETGREFVRAPACLMREYALDPYVTFVLFDPANQAERVTPENLGDGVELGVFPGPGGGS
ncbi:phage baseplate plug protein [Halorussus sp. MSC15.2]|uniref:phage baseplate plug family protein n=1 Tax=Halorussus sp. MSC15.2 TaxID=2283638 RepID=UPI0013D2038A|nr:hypothetical protein [Halorussus sp. MSC15.2]NEU58589.1 hypothetical protein [Halorussus sp. MSC15.2]